MVFPCLSHRFPSLKSFKFYIQVFSNILLVLQKKWRKICRPHYIVVQMHLEINCEFPCILELFIAPLSTIISEILLMNPASFGNEL